LILLLFDSFVLWFFHSIILSFFESLILWFFDSFIQAIGHAFIYLFIHPHSTLQPCIQSIIQTFIVPFLHSVLQSFIQSFLYSVIVIHSFIHSFIRSINHSFMFLSFMLYPFLQLLIFRSSIKAIQSHMFFAKDSGNYRRRRRWFWSVFACFQKCDRTQGAATGCNQAAQPLEGVLDSLWNFSFIQFSPSFTPAENKMGI
jgi:hypothetical protein